MGCTYLLKYDMSDRSMQFVPCGLNEADHLCPHTGLCPPRCGDDEARLGHKYQPEAR